MMKTISILGSTGSIGCNTLNVVRHLKDRFSVAALAAKSNIDLLESQAREFQPELIAVYDKEQACQLQKRLPSFRIEAGLEGLKAVATHHQAQMVVSAMSGTMGLVPTIAAIEAGKDIGLANKEVLVSGGALITSLIKKHKVNLLPIDSEHSALFQCLQGQSKQAVRRLILTASGGPFRAFSSEQLQEVTPEQALRHPNWTMGAKVTIDSSTLMNKGLEVIEAHWLFDIPIHQISVVIHPQSIVHSMVEYVDGSLLAHLGEPTMLVPIQYALTYPERLPGMLQPFDFTKYGTLQFYAPDSDKFRCLHLACEAIRIGGSMPCYMNAANDVLVNQFLDKQISWFEISARLEALMEKHQVGLVQSIEDVLRIEHQAREESLAF